MNLDNQNQVKFRFDRLMARMRRSTAMRHVLAGVRHRLPSRAHRLPGPLIVSLTSYPPRYPSLPETLKSLLSQSIRPDGVVLWIADGDISQLPTEVRELCDKKVELHPVPDIRSYKKLVFALKTFPDAFIVTADDDILYPYRWLEDLVKTCKPGEQVIICHRAHRITADCQSSFADYMTWEWDVQDSRARQPSCDLIPTGMGGILYPPSVLHPDVTDDQVFMQLCPTADDLWFYWMARRAGTFHRKVGGVFEHSYLPGSQDETLFAMNTTQNDVQIAALLKRFGNPLVL